MTKGIRTQAQIDAATEPAAKVRAAYLVDRLRDDLPHYAKTGGLSFWQVVFLWGVAGGCLLIGFDLAGIVWGNG